MQRAGCDLPWPKGRPCANAIAYLEINAIASVTHQQDDLNGITNFKETDG
ncbi:hypothetical protein [Moorena sp. SIO4G3]|nr:hypothetical protein [Moorena sp. SIO4G3]NEO75684.1 hypothetical protein [Moorena sp. SIO4G3]